MSGTGTTSTDGNCACAEPCRPSIQATSGRANPGTSLHGTPADVSSGPPSEATLAPFFLDIKTLHRFDRGGLTIARPVSLPNGRIPLREPPCPGRQVGEGVSPTLDAVPHIIDRNLRFQSSGRKILSHRPAPQKMRLAPRLGDESCHEKIFVALGMHWRLWHHFRSWVACCRNHVPCCFRQRCTDEPIADRISNWTLCASRLAQHSGSDATQWT